MPSKSPAKFSTKIESSHKSQATFKNTLEKVLVASNNFYQQVLESLEDYAVFTTDTAGYITTWNTAAKRILGYSDTEIIGKNASVLFTPEDQNKKAPEKEIQNAIKNGRTKDERWHARKDNSLFWGSGLVFPLMDDTGDHVGFTKMVRDLSEQKRLQTEAELQARGFKDLFRQAPAAIAVLSGPDHIYQLANSFYQKIFARSEKELLGKPLKKVFPEIAGQGIYEIFDQVRATGEPFIAKGFPAKYDQSGSGTARKGYFNFVVQPVKNQEGEVDRILVHATETTEQVLAQKRAEEELKTKTALLENMVEGVSLSDETGIITYTNPAENKMFGYEPGELIGQHVSVQNTYPPKENERIVKEVISQLKKSGVWQGEFSNKKKDGTPFITSTKITALDINGKKHWLCVQTDVTESKKTADQLLESEKRFRALLEHSADAIALTDAQGTVTYASPSVKKLLGYTAEEMEGKPGAMFIHPDDLEMTRVKLGGIMQHSGKALTVEHRAVHKNGTIKWVETTATNLFEEPSVGAVVTNFRDVTERKLAEEALKDTRNQLEAAIAAGTIAVWTWDIPGGLVLGDKNMAKFFGVKVSEIKSGLPTSAFTEAIHPDDRANIKDYVDRAVNSGESYEAEYRLVSRQGTVRWVIARGKVEYDPDGKALRFPGVMMDITERKKAEDRLRESEERAQAVFKEAAVPMSVTAPDGTWIAFNRVYPRMFGYTTAQLRKMTFTQITHPDDRQTDKVNVRRLLNGEIAQYKREKRYIHKNGSIVYAIIRATVVRDESGQPKYMIAVLQNITKRKRAEEMLRESEERFRASFEQAAVGMAHTSLDGKWLQVNQTLCDMLGLTKRQLLRKTFQDVTYPEDLPSSESVMRQLLNGDTNTHSIEKRYIKHDGAVIWANVTVALVRDENGEPKYFSSVIENITKRKQMEESIQLSELRYRTMIEQSPLSTQILSPEGTTLQVNDAWEKLWGAKLEQLQGYNMLKDKQLVKLGIMPYIKKGFAGEPALIPAVRYEPQKTIPDITSVPFRWVRAFIYPVKDTKGTVREVVLIHEDITEEKKAQSALIESEERFRHLADSMPQMVWTARPDGHTDYYNQQWYEYTGFKETFGNQSWEPILHPDDVKRCHDTWYNSVKTGEPYQIEYRFKDRFNPGKYRWFLGRALPVKDKQGKIIKWFGTCTDIDDVRRTLERKNELEKITTALTAQRAQLVLLNRAKDEFISVASHQLRTPATGVKQYLGMTLEGYAGKLTKQQRAFLTQAYESNERQINIVNDLLRVAKVDAGKVNLDKKKTNLVAMVENIIREQKSKFMERDQKVQFICSQQKINVEIDPDKMRMVIENIIDNASKYTPHGRNISIKISKVKDHACITVQDEGVGVSKKDLLKIFHKFSRLDNPLSIKVGGTGLGLYWAKKITDLHGGTIEVESVLNKGSIFTIKIPM